MNDSVVSQVPQEEPDGKSPSLQQKPSVTKSTFKGFHKKRLGGLLLKILPVIALIPLSVYIVAAQIYKNQDIRSKAATQKQGSEIVSTAIDPRIGVAHLAGTYPDRHSQGDFVLYGVQKAKELGFQSLEILIDPRLCWRTQTDRRPYGFYQTRSYCQENSDLTKFASLAEMAQQPEFQQALDQPLKRFIVSSDSLNPKAANQVKIGRANQRFSAEELNLLYQEFKDYAVYLIRRYNSTGKTVVLLTPSEIDWHILAPTNCKPNCEDTDPPAANLQNAVDYLNMISSAINQAKKEIAPQNFKLYHACEINLVKKTLTKGKKSAASDVVPRTNCDLYGYSAYETFLNLNPDARDLFIKALDYIAERAPDHPDFGAKNVFISEVGIQENQRGSAKLIEIFKPRIPEALNWGVPYLQIWQLYDNECNRFNPKNADCVGFWIVKPDGSLSTMYTAVLQPFHAITSRTSPASIKESRDDAEIVSQSVVSRVEAGARFTATITVRNTGTSTWTEDQQFRLGAINPYGNSTWGTGRVKLTESVKPGEIYTFTAELKAPSEPGTYNFQWRMVHDTVRWFGKESKNVSIAVEPRVSTPTPPVPSLTNKLKCASYIIDDKGTEQTFCAVCGNGSCETNETCTSSTPNTFDCGPLYCPRDCPQQTPASSTEDIPQDL